MTRTTVRLAGLMAAVVLLSRGTAAEFEVRGGSVPRSKAFYMRDTRHYAHPPASPKTFARYVYPVGRGSYPKFIRNHPDRWNHFNPNPQRFLQRPKHHKLSACHDGLFTLVEYLATGKKEYADALNWALTMMKPGYEEYVKKKKWVGVYHAWFAQYGWIVHRELKKRKALTPEADRAFRAGILYMLEHLHVWNTPQTFWRGPMHRSQTEAWLRRLAVRSWPDIPQAKAWTAYEKAVWNDFWPYRDYPTNDTGYSFGILVPHLLGAEIAGMKTFFTDPGMMKVWERLLYTTCPDGSVIPYGAHGGWNSTAGHRMWMFELIARHTRDGRFRWAAQRIFKYLTIIQEENLSHNWGTDRECYYGAALAYLFADEGVKPVPPDGASRVLFRKETLRLRDKNAAKKYLQPLKLFEDKDKGHMCCNLIVTQKTVPAKVVFSSGTAPGDMYMLVDAFPRHDPLNPTAILGLVQYGAPFTQTISAKGRSGENRIQVEDVGRTAKLVRNTDPNLMDEYYMTVTVKPFSDHRLATHTKVNVTDYMGFRVDLSREFLFVKNRMVLVRDVLVPKDTFRARIAPVWNTQNAGPELGVNWANTFMSIPSRDHITYLACPPRDLLVYHAPRPGRRLRIDLRPEKQAQLRIPYGVRYQYEGIVEPGKHLAFAQVLIPQKPTLTPSDLAGRVATLSDTADLVAFAVETDKGRTEIVMLNTPGAKRSIGGVQTDARQVYLDVAGGDVRRVLAIDGTFLIFHGKSVFRHKERTVFEKTEAK